MRMGPPRRAEAVHATGISQQLLVSRSLNGRLLVEGPLYAWHALTGFKTFQKCRFAW